MSRQSKEIRKATDWKPCPADVVTEAAAHELGHVIGHITTERYFGMVWVAGVSQPWDSYNQPKDSKKHVGGHVASYQHGTMVWDAKRERVKCVNAGSISPEQFLIVLMAGIAGEEVFAGQERPRSIIDLSQEYRQWESKTDSYGDFRMAQKWVKQGVSDGYFYAREVWGVLQHFYNQAFWAVRNNKEFLIATIPVLAKRGVLWNTEVLKLWHGFYRTTQILKSKAAMTATKTADKTKTTDPFAKGLELDIRDNTEATTEEDTTMKFNEAETYVLHYLSTNPKKGYVTRDEVVRTFERGVGGYYRFAYVDGRRYDFRGLAKKEGNVLYLLQRMGLVSVDKDQSIKVTLPKDIIIPPVAPLDTWKKDVTTLTEAFKKSVEATKEDFSTLIDAREVEHVIKNYPVPPEVSEAFDALAATVKELGAIRHEENNIKQANDLLGRDIVTLKKNDELRLRFLLELSLPALKAAAKRLLKDYPEKPANYDKMKKKERDACGWTSYEAKWIADFVAAAEAGTLIDDFHQLRLMSYRLDAASANAAWRIEAARRHPDQGGSAEASARFGEIWDRVEKSFPKADAAAAGK
jgi:hypothetical protein